MEIQERYLPTNSLRFHLLTAGKGERLMLFLHGFPDAPTSMIPLMRKAARNGYYAVAPYMRGYGQTGRPSGDNYFISDLARDCVSIIDALNVGEGVLVGHDWGAIAGYAAANRSPGRISRLVALSVPPLSIFFENCLRHPRQLLHSWYVFFFQAPLLPELAIKRGDFQCLESIWRRWSPGWHPPEDYLEAVKDAFRTDGTPRAAIGYYRALLRDGLTDRRRYRKSRKLSFDTISVPSLIMTGLKDRSVLPQTYTGLERAYEVDYEFYKMEDVGHFPHLEATDEVFERIFDYLEQSKHDGST